MSDKVIDIPKVGQIAFPDSMSDQEINAAATRLYQQANPGQKQPPVKSWIDTAVDWAGDVATGVAKGAAHTAIDLGRAVHAVPGVGAATDAIGNAIGGAVGKMVYGTTAAPVSGDKAFDAAREQTAYSNPAQRVGGALETVAEMGVPISKGVEALPNAARAGAKFQSVMAAARNVPVDVNAPGQVALRISELAERGGSMPMAVRKFLARVTDGTKGDLTYEEARDFASNISRLSANEYGRLTPVIAREVSQLRVVLNKAVADAAAKAGKGAEYASAMKEYAKAMRLRDAIDAAVQGIKRGIPYGLGAGAAGGAGYWLSKHVSDLLGGSE